jgi:hypothetical protein
MSIPSKNLETLWKKLISFVRVVVLLSKTFPATALALVAIAIKTLSLSVIALMANTMTYYLEITPIQLQSKKSYV